MEIEELDVIVSAFSQLLENAGFFGAINLIIDDLIPIAEKKHISLYDAAWEYADQDEEQDTSYFQLFHVLQSIPKENIDKVIIEKPL